MRLEDFIDNIASGEFAWRLDDGAITESDNECCPIWAMYYRWSATKSRPAEDVFEAGRQLGLTTRQVARFISAADHPDTPYKGLREKLMRATVLSALDS